MVRLAPQHTNSIRLYRDFDSTLLLAQVALPSPSRGTIRNKVSIPHLNFPHRTIPEGATRRF
jgi:hypothetical protein